MLADYILYIYLTSIYIFMINKFIVLLFYYSGHEIKASSRGFGPTELGILKQGPIV